MVPLATGVKGLECLCLLHSHLSSSSSSPLLHVEASTVAATPVGFDPSSILLSSDLSQSIRLLKCIPRTSRHLAACKLTSTLDEVTVKNDSALWARLFQFSYCCFFAPSRGGHRGSIATMVNKQLRDEAGSSVLL